MIKNFLKFAINSIQARNDCVKKIQSLDTDKDFFVFICNEEKAKTLQQCKFFHKLLDEFVRIANESGFSGVCENNVGWWKYQIKKTAEFYDTTKGCLFSKERAKEINEELKTLSPDVRQDIIKAITMRVKSVEKATTKELMVLIDNLIIQIVYNLPQQNILQSELLTSTIIKRYNQLLNNESTTEDNLKASMLMLMDDKLIFEEKNGEYFLKRT